MATEIHTFSIVGPHGGTNLSDLAKIVPGTFMVILILHVKKTQFGTEKAFCVKKFLNFRKSADLQGLVFLHGPEMGLCNMFGPKMVLCMLSWTLLGHCDIGLVADPLRKQSYSEKILVP